MAEPDIFKILLAVPELKALLGPTKPFRIFEVEADQNTPVPYVVYATTNGNVENYLSGDADADQITTSFDVYAKEIKDAKHIRELIRGAVVGKGYVTALLGETRDFETRAFVSTFDVDWIIDRL